MNQVVTEKTVEAIEKGVIGATEIATKGATVLIDETIKLYIFYGIIGILKAAMVFVVFGIIWRALNALDMAGEKSAVIRASKTCLLVLSMVYFTFSAIPHVMDIGKAVVAPNLFIAEKGLAAIRGDNNGKK